MKNGESSYRRFMEGDISGFEEVVGIYKNNLIYFLNRYVHSIEISEDIAADTFADIFVNKNRYNFKASLKTYIFTIGRNKAVNYMRKNAKVIALSMEDIDNDMTLADYSTLEDLILKEERNKHLNAALDKINNDYRTVLHLLYFEDLSYEDVAKILGKNKKQIDNLAYRAKNSLKSILEKEGFCYEIQ